MPRSNLNAPPPCNGAWNIFCRKSAAARLNLFLRQIDDKVQRVSQLESGRYVERPVNVGQAHETSVVVDFKTKLASLPALTLRGNASTSRLTLEDTALSSRQESPRHSGNLGFAARCYSRRARSVN